MAAVSKWLGEQKWKNMRNENETGDGEKNLTIGHEDAAYIHRRFR